MGNTIIKIDKQIGQNGNVPNTYNNLNSDSKILTVGGKQIEALSVLDDVADFLGSTFEQQLAISKYKRKGSKISYDDDGNAIVDNTNVYDGYLSGIVYTIDRNGKVIKEVQYYNPRHGDPVRIEIIYNSDGSSIEDQYFESGYRKHIERYFNGKLKKKTYYDNNGKMYHNEECTADGNVSKITHYYYDEGYYTVEYPQQHKRFYYDLSNNVISEETC